MVVRLQTAEGKIKEYQTIKGVGNCIGERYLGSKNGLPNAEENGTDYLSPIKNAAIWSA